MKLISLWGPVVLHMTIIFVGSSSSDVDLPSGGILDKLAHLGVYAILGALLARAVAGGRLGVISARDVAVAVVLSTLYGVTDEWHQSFVPGRTPDAMDILADSIGAFTGALFVLAAGRLLAARQTASRVER